MQIDLTSNLRQALAEVDDLFRSQVPFATAKALTDTARKVAAEMPARVLQDLDKPTAFTQRGFYSTPARKDNLEAVVGVKDRQAEYLRWQIEGGERAPSRLAQRLPTAVQLDGFGNVPAGLIRQLVARAKAGRRATKRQAGRFGVSQKAELFYGDPSDGRPAGIYKRVQAGARSHLVPLIVFPRVAAKYRARFDFAGAAAAIADREFAAAFDSAMQQATATAR